MNTPISSVAETSDRLVTFTSKMKISDALQLLSIEGVSSAPVLDESTRCIGAADALDMMTYVLNVPNSDYDTWSKDVKQKFQDPVARAVDSSLINPFYPIQEDQTVGDVVDNFFKYGIHRLPIVKPNLLVPNRLEISGMVSQSDIIRFLFKSSLEGDKVIQEFMKIPVEDAVNIVKGNVITVNEDMRLKDAFNVLINANVSGVAVLNSQGQFMGNLSASDFEGFTESNFPSLNAKVKDMISSQLPYVCGRTTTLGKVLENFADSHVHRIYVTDAELNPLGIVTMTDVMQLVAKHLIHPKLATIDTK